MPQKKVVYFLGSPTQTQGFKKLDATLKKYKVEAILGNGAFGFVFKVTDLETEESYALKR